MPLFVKPSPSRGEPSPTELKVPEGKDLATTRTAELQRRPEGTPPLATPQGSSPRATPLPLPPTAQVALERRHAAALQLATGVVTRDLNRPPLTDAQRVAWQSLADQGSIIDKVVKVNGEIRSVRLDLNPDHSTYTPEAMHGKHPLHVKGEIRGIRIAQPLPQGMSAAEQERLTYRRNTSQGLLVSSVQTDPEGRTTRVISMAVNNPDPIITFPDFDPSREASLGLLNRCHIGHEPVTPPHAPPAITH